MKAFKLFLLILVVPFFYVLADDSMPLDALKAEMAVKMRDAENMRDFTVEAIYDQYGKHLSFLADFYRSRGKGYDFSMVEQEMDRFKKEKTLPEDVDHDSALQKNMVDLLGNLLAKADLEMRQSKIKLHKEYQKKFDNAKKTLSREGSIEDAAIISAEIGVIKEAENNARSEIMKAISEIESRSSKINVPEPADGRKLNPGESFVIDLGLGFKMEFAWCPATTSDEWKKISGGKDFFLMGSPEDETDRRDDEVLHEVILTKGFWIGKCEVTQDQFNRFFLEKWRDTEGEKAISHVSQGALWKTEKNKGWHNTFTGGSKPVVCISQNDASEFCEWMSDKTGKEARLPTEAEWEYACRAGTNTKYNTGDTDEDLAEAAWYRGNSEYAPHDVGQRKPNQWGLYDMHGNVHEWCGDRCDWEGSGITTDTYWDGVEDPFCQSGSRRLTRGGSYSETAGECCSADRGGVQGISYSNLGFRVVIIP